MTDERDHLPVRHHARLEHLAIGGQELGAAGPAANKELAVDQLMSGHLIATEERVQGSRVRRSVGEKPNPYGRIDQDHQATLRFADGLSRRRDRSRA